jgi:adenylate kinase
MKCFVGGIGGVGKTTIVRALKEVHGDCEIIYGSQVLFQALSIPIGDYDALRAVPPQLKDGVFDKEITAILGRMENYGRHLLLDAHYLSFIDERPYRVVGDWISQMDVLVLIETRADVILDRLKAGVSRSDRMDRSVILRTSSEMQLDVINRLLAYSRTEAERLSIEYHKPLKMIDNSHGVALAIEAFADILAI